MGFLMPKWMYYLFSFTWGILLTAAGFIVAGILMLMGHRPQKFCYGWYFNVGGNFGGFSAGPISIVSTESVLKHEFGHSIQNCIFGPLMFIYVVIPSVVRYWYRELFDISEPEYDYAWFENQATMFGKRYAGVS